MKIYNRVVIDSNGVVLEEDSFEYDGPLALADSSAPQPTSAETALTAEQTQLLQMQQDLLAQQMATYDLLSPFLYSDLGLVPTYGDVANPEYLDIQNQIAQIETQLAGMSPTTTIYHDRSGSPETIENPQYSQLVQQMEALNVQLGAMAPTISQLTGFTEDPEQAEIKRLMEERQLAALKGELPLDPSLTRGIETQEEELRNRLRANLGEGYETSTPGIEAMAEFGKRAEELRYAASRGEIFDTSMLNAGLSESRMGQIFGLYGLPSQSYAGANSLMQGYGSTLGQMFANRELSAQARMSSQASLASLFGTAIGAGAGIYALSDERVKTDIKEVGTTESGVPVYTYRFKGDPVVRMGVLAQEVEELHPDLVMTDIFSGLKLVNYEGIK